MLSFLAMSAECPFLKGNSDFQCNTLKALPVVKNNAGLTDFPLVGVMELVCKSNTEDRGKDCPVFTELQSLGRGSQFARPVTNNRPLR